MRILTREVVCVREHLTLAEVAGVLVEYGVNGVPVVDAHAHLIGLVTKTDVVAAVGRGASLEQVVVGEVMVRHVITILESSSISRAAAVMAFKRVHRLPVLSDEGCVVGIVSAMDVLQETSDRKGYLMPPHSLPPPCEAGLASADRVGRTTTLPSIETGPPSRALRRHLKFVTCHGT